jgi:hypothetical protein
MPLLFAPFVAALLGFALAVLGRHELARHDGALQETRTFRVSVYYAALIFAPVLGYMLLFHGDWFYLFLLPASRVPSVASALGIGASAAVMPAMVLLARRPLGTRAPLASSAIVTLLLLLLRRRLGSAATYLQFHGDFGLVSSGAGPLGLSVLVCVVALAAGLALAYRRLSVAG